MKLLINQCCPLLYFYRVEVVYFSLHAYLFPILQFEESFAVKKQQDINAS